MILKCFSELFKYFSNQKGWTIWSPFSKFSFKTLKDPNATLLIRFWYILYDLGVFLSVDLASWEKNILTIGCTIWSLLFHFSFRTLKFPNSHSLLRFQCIYLMYHCFSQLFKTYSSYGGWSTFLRGRDSLT